MFARDLNDLKIMLPSEYEEWRERGDDFRRALSHAVISHITTPENWQVNAEYRTEFGGLFPVQCRFSPPGEPWHVCVCSPGELSPAWTMILVSGSGNCVRLLLAMDVFNPEIMMEMLCQTAALARMRCSVDRVAAILAAEVVS